MRIKSSNPAISGKNLQSFISDISNKKMTVSGAIDRTGILLIILITSGALTYSALYRPWEIIQQIGTHPMLYIAMIGGAILALITALVVIFKPNTAPLSAPIYAVLEGIFLDIFVFRFSSRINHDEDYNMFSY